MAVFEQALMIVTMNKKAPIAVVILAAGKGTRMKSAKSKVLHEIAGLPLIGHTIKLSERLDPERIIVVLGPDMKEVEEAVKPHTIAIQENARGTGDALKAALPALEGFQGSDILVLYGDMPLIEEQDLKGLIGARFAEENAGISILGMRPEFPGAYGRMIMAQDGTLEKIVEAKDASPEELNIDLCNAGIYCIEAAHVKKWVEAIDCKNAQNEYYLTDLPAIAKKEGYATVICETEEENAQGVNSRIELSYAEQIFQNRMRSAFLEDGVTMADPNTVYFAYDTELGRDVTLGPNIVFGPGVVVEDNVEIKSFSYLEDIKITEGTTIGPFENLTRLKEKRKTG